MPVPWPHVERWGGRESYRARAIRAHEERCAQCSEARFTGAPVCDEMWAGMTESLKSPLLQELLAVTRSEAA